MRICRLATLLGLPIWIALTILARGGDVPGLLESRMTRSGAALTGAADGAPAADRSLADRVIGDLPDPSSILAAMILNGTTHFVYNSTSYAVLTRVHPLTHAILNVSRRFVIIIASMIATSAVISTTTTLGPIIVTIGAGLYIHLRRARAAAATAAAQ
jgi:hypothetical protein